MSPSGPRSFPLFSHLPTEIQNMIWQIILSQPRVISGEDCFREWWFGRIRHFLLPAALQVCRNSRFLAQEELSLTFIHIPGISGWRPFYINQAIDFFAITKRDVLLNFKISQVIQDPELVRRVVILGIASDRGWLEKNVVHYLKELSMLQEVILTDRVRPFLAQKISALRSCSCKTSQEADKLVKRIHQFFESEVMVTALGLA